MIDGFSKLILENKTIRTVFIPELGGKMIELSNKQTGTQFLKEPEPSFGPYQKAYYGDEFETFDASGFDECFPTISPSKFSFGGRDITLPDHGELWSQSWKHENIDAGIKLTGRGIQIDYEFSKAIRLIDNSISISYKLINRSQLPFNYLWSAHPLLHVEPGSEILLPKDIKQVALHWSSDDTFGKHGDSLSWPDLMGKDTNYSMIPDLSAGKAVKLFSDRLHTGYAGIYRKDVDESLMFRFNVDQIPYLGLWLCYGGWPVDSDEKHLTVGLEPTNCKSDSLGESVNTSKHSYIDSGETICWELELSIVPGKA